MNPYRFVRTSYRTTEFRPCKVSRQSFCYICGRYLPSKKRKTITGQLKVAYSLYFNEEIIIKPWTPTSSCQTCYYTLMEWRRKKNRSLPFSMPMIWRSPRNHIDDCFFCSINITGYNNSNSKSITYPNVSSITRPTFLPSNSTNTNPTSVPSESENLTVHYFISKYRLQ